jgi:signal transduction histidine kinase
MGTVVEIPTPLAWLETEPGPAAWITPDGRLGAANAAYAVWVGASPESLVGRTRNEVLLALVGPRLASLDPLQPLLTTETPAEPFSALLTAGGDGRQRWYQSVPLRDADGRPAGCLDRCLAPEAAPAEAWPVAPSTEQDQFLARFSHELRTPMTAIIGFCHMLLDYSGPITAPQQGYVQKILKNASILLQMLNNVMDLAKMREGLLSPCPEQIDLVTLLGDVVASVEPQTFEKAIPILVDVHPDVPDIVSDRLKLKQLLINLLSNAAKYTDEGQIDVRVELGSGEVLVSVRDTGIGIPADALDRIFEAYVQIDDPRRKRAQPSTGLGLTICRALGELLRGRLTVTSEPGSGSCFTLALPLQWDPQAPAPRA